MRFLRVCAAQHSHVPPLLSVGVRPFSTAELMARITFRDVVFPAVPSSGATINLAELAAQIEWNVWYEPECGPLGAFLDRASGGAVTVLGDTVTRSGHSQPQKAPTATLSDIGSLLYSHTPPSAPNAPTFPGTPKKDATCGIVVGGSASLKEHSALYPDMRFINISLVGVNSVTTCVYGFNVVPGLGFYDVYPHIPEAEDGITLQDLASKCPGSSEDTVRAVLATFPHFVRLSAKYAVRVFNPDGTVREGPSPWRDLLAEVLVAAKEPTPFRVIETGLNWAEKHTPVLK